MSRVSQTIRSEADRVIDKVLDTLLGADHPLVARLQQIDELMQAGDYEGAAAVRAETEARYGLQELRSLLNRDVHRRFEDWLKTYGQERVPRRTRRLWAQA